MYKQILQLLLLFITCQGFSQTSIKAIITDRNKKPVDFASIYLPDNRKSTISNEDGEFYLIINPEIDKKVIINHLSYQPLEIKITDNFPKTIVMEEGAFQLEEIAIGNQITGYDIALKVVENLKKNHDVDPAYYEYFTRICSYSEDRKILNLVQEYYGVLQHTPGHSTKWNIKKSRMVPYTSRGEEIINKERSMDLWFTRNNNLLLYKPDFLKKSKLKKYEISIEGSANLNGIDCYVLKYTNEDADYDRKAIAYVDKNTYALVKLILGDYSTESNYYIERNFVNIANKWYLSTVNYKHANNKTYSTLYTYLVDSKDYNNEEFTPTLEIFHEKVKSFNKNPNDTFWNNYQHIPLPEN